MTIANGKLVSLEYTLTDDEQEILDTNVGGEPFLYVHGRREIVIGLETALSGKKAGDTLTVVVKPEEAYGVRNEKALIEVPLDRIPEEARKVGTQLQGQGADGNPVFPVVKAVREDAVVLDFNHPLAGKTLHFDVKILGVEEPSQDGDGADAGQDAAPESSRE